MRTLIAIVALVACSGAWAKEWGDLDFWYAGECSTAYLLSFVDDGEKNDEVDAEAKRQALMRDTKADVWDRAELYWAGQTAMGDFLSLEGSDSGVQQEALKKIVKDDCAKWLPDD